MVETVRDVTVILEGGGTGLSQYRRSILILRDVIGILGGGTGPFPLVLLVLRLYFGDNPIVSDV